MPPKPKPQPKPRRLTEKQIKAAAGIERGVNRHRAYLDAGYSPKSAKTHPYNPLENVRILRAVEQRKAEIMKAANIHTNVLIGSLAEMATASIADVDPDNPFLQRAKELGTDHLIKKCKTVTRLIPQQGVDEFGKKLPPIVETTTEFEMYSRLEAINALRDTWGMKKEARPYDGNDLEAAILEFQRRAADEGIDVDYETARSFMEPRLASKAIN